MKSSFFITGIGTDVGKTIAAAIVTEALEADYWKPVQAGDLDNSDSHKVRRLISNTTTTFHNNSFALTKPMSPHAAAKRDGIDLTSEKIKRPKTNNHLVIEGAGGLLVPLNDKETIIDLILPQDRIILVSRHYLGSINHTLLSIEAIKARGFDCFGVIFSGNENLDTEEIILKKTKVHFLGRIEEEPYFDRNVIKQYAQDFRYNLNRQ